MSARFLNPYRNRSGRWLRANFHGHCSENSGCATVPLGRSAQMYRDIGARVMAVTDHDAITDLDELRRAHPEMIFLEGFEYSTRENILFIGERVPPLYRFSLEDALQRAGDLLTIVCHPQPDKNEPYWTRAMIMALGRLPDGIEIYNGHYGTPSMLARGHQPQYTALWDELLTNGQRLWGFANDDFHEPEDFNNAWNMVLVAEPSPRAVLPAVKAGCFYGTTGLLLERIRETEGRIEIALQTAAVGRFIGPGGEILSESEGERFEYRATGEAYVRFEATDAAGKLFLQPLFRE